MTLTFSLTFGSGCQGKTRIDCSLTIAKRVLSLVRDLPGTPSSDTLAFAPRVKRSFATVKGIESRDDHED